MAETLVNWFISTYSFLTTSELGKSVLVFGISLLPILELRGGLLAAYLLKLGIVKSFIITLIGTMIPVPFILLFIKNIKLSIIFIKKIFTNREKYGKLIL